MLDLDTETNPEILRQAAKLAMADNARLVQRIVALTEEVAKLRGTSQKEAQLELDRLREQLAELRGELYGKQSERRGNRTKQDGQKQRRRGHGPRPQLELERVETEHELDEADKVCPKCGGALDEWEGQEEQSEEVDVIERKFVIRVHRKKKYRCCQCHDHVETAPGPEKLIPGGRYSLRFAIAVAMSKYGDHLPLERQVRIMRREGLVVDSQTLWDQLWALTRALRSTYLALGDYVRSALVICADETPWKMLGKGTKGKWYLWGACRKQAAYYEIMDGRSKEAGAQLLQDYSGTLVCDGYPVYSSLAKARAAAEQMKLGEDAPTQARAGPLVLACCWAHARRPFAKLEDKYPQDCEQILDLIGELYEVERQVPFEPAEGEALHKQLGLRAKLRDEVSRPIVDRIMAWAEQAQTRFLPSSKMGDGIKFLINQRQRLQVFLDDPLVPIDNNQMERGLRGPVLGRKNFYGTKTKRGAEAAAVLYSIIESCKLARVEPKAYLLHAARFAVTHRDDPDAVPPLPHQFREMQAQT